MSVKTLRIHVRERTKENVTLDEPIPIMPLEPEPDFTHDELVNLIKHARKQRWTHAVE